MATIIQFSQDTIKATWRELEDTAPLFVRAGFGGLYANLAGRAVSGLNIAPVTVSASAAAVFYTAQSLASAATNNLFLGINKAWTSSSQRTNDMHVQVLTGAKIAADLSLTAYALTSAAGLLGSSSSFAASLVSMAGFISAAALPVLGFAVAWDLVSVASRSLNVDKIENRLTQIGVKALAIAVIISLGRMLAERFRWQNPVVGLFLTSFSPVIVGITYAITALVCEAAYRVFGRNKNLSHNYAVNMVKFADLSTSFNPVSYLIGTAAKLSGAYAGLSATSTLLTRAVNMTGSVSATAEQIRLVSFNLAVIANLIRAVALPTMGVLSLVYVMPTIFDWFSGKVSSMHIDSADTVTV